jgi:quinoprotein glucose dehydrogenase
MMRISLLLAVLVAPLGCQPSSATAQLELVDAFPAQDKFRRPLYLDYHLSDPAHFYVVEQFGTVYRIPRDAEARTRHVFLDWTHKTLHPDNGGHNEEGLLGFAFDPDYARNRFVYIYASQRVARGRQRSVISRLTVQDGEHGPRAMRDSELEILVQAQPFPNHNGGTIIFGSDGMLYVALGDGGAADDPFKSGQDLKTLLGKVLRIDVRGATAEKPYAVPDDNPFAGRGEGVRGEIWAYGLRNPWRISFDRTTGEMWCGDVGQNLWEEVDRIVKGGNYGWNLREAHREFPPKKMTDAARAADQAAAGAKFIEPVAYYPRPDGYSITGGYVYRGQRHQNLQGWFVYADFVTGHVWACREDREHGKHTSRTIAEAGAKQVASFAELPDGELLLLCFDGRLYELR